MSPDELAAIEAEAVAAERARLREAVRHLDLILRANWRPMPGRWVNEAAILSLLADDEEDGR